jgi:hypothetical protein
MNKLIRKSFDYQVKNGSTTFRMGMRRGVIINVPSWGFKTVAIVDGITRRLFTYNAVKQLVPVIAEKRITKLTNRPASSGADKRYIITQALNRIKHDPTEFISELRRSMRTRVLLGHL